MKVRLLLILCAAIFVTSCSSRKRVVKVKPTKKTEKQVTVVKPTPKKKTAPPKKKIVYKDIKRAYVAQYSDIAMDEMRKYKIPASITLAQGILESRSGQSELTRKSNNHFGIKCHKGWTGAKTYYDDDEKGECFRVYKHPEKSFKDHSLFLAERTRYADLFKLKITDYKGWAKGLKKAGYATDKAYPQKLIAIIETYELYDYDDMVLGKKKRRKKEVKPKSNISTETIIVVKGDALYSISKRFGLTVDELKKLNGLTDNNISIGQELIIKKNSRQKQGLKSIPNKKVESMTVVKGDTLYSIAKRYGLSVDQLKKLNHLPDNTISIGQELLVGK